VTGAPPALEIRGVSKTFASTTVLDDFRLSIAPGEVHVLVGENGSGKSTLIKVLSGYHEPDPGSEVLIAGSPLDFGAGERSYRAGCRFVHQDLGLIGDASVLDNLALGAGYATRLGTIRRRAAIRDATEQLARVGSAVDPRSLLRDLGAAERTGVAVARAMRPDPAHPARVLVLDEPTASLPADDVDRLLEMIRATARAGVAILFVTHHLDEVFRIADRVTVLRDGRIVRTSAVGDIDRSRLVELLVGDGWREEEPPPVSELDRAEPVLDVRGLGDGTLLDVSFEVAPGEIVGIAGLTGSGRESILGAVFGSSPRTAGEILVAGTPVRHGRPHASITRGIAYLPPDRKSLSGLMTMTCRENLTLARLGSVSTPGWLHHRRERRETATWFERLDVRPRNGVDRPLSSLSGGNQQKVLLAKWMRLAPRIFLLDEPTQGVDIGAKAEVHRNLRDMAATGAAVVIASTDAEELPALCHRVIVLRAGRVSHVLTGSDLTISGIKNAVLGASAAHQKESQ